MMTNLSNEKSLFPKNRVKLYFPKKPPYESVLDYRISKNFENAPKFYPEFDVVRQHDPYATLAMLQIKQQKTERQLGKKRKELGGKREDLDRQWQELEKSEKSLRDNFEHYDTFIRENVEKRARAMKKIKENAILQEQRRCAIGKLQENMDDCKKVKCQMDKKIREFHIYENFFEQCIQTYVEFNLNQDIIDRYLALLDTKMNLAKLQEENLIALENAQSDMLKLIEENRFIIIGLNNHIASLQARFENANIKTLEGEQLVLAIKNNAVIKLNEIDEVECSIWNLCQHMAKYKNHPFKIDNLEKQMVYIKQTLTELSSLNDMLKSGMMSLKNENPQ